MILVDFNGVAIGSIVSQNLEVDEDLIRHTILNTLRAVNKRFRSKYGGIVIACDSRSWRRDYFPNYKYKRRKSKREDSKDWDEITRIANQMLDEIRENFHYKVIKVEGAEADDIIGALALEAQEFGRGENVLIISADKDFLQLQKFKNVDQYSPHKGEFVREQNPRTFLFEHILKGDSSDGIPNVLSDDDIFLQEGTRQSPVTKKKIEAWTAGIDDLQGTMDEEVYRNFKRNKVLIDLEEMPQEIREEIVAKYDESTPTDKSKIFNYLIKYRCKNLLSDIEDFY
jgi:5'-3' exonuclease